MKQAVYPKYINRDGDILVFEHVDGNGEPLYGYYIERSYYLCNVTAEDIYNGSDTDIDCYCYDMGDRYYLIKADTGLHDYRIEYEGMEVKTFSAPDVWEARKYFTAYCDGIYDTMMAMGDE